MKCHTLTSNTFLFTFTCKLDNESLIYFVVWPSGLSKVHNSKKYWALLCTKISSKICIFYLVALFSEMILKAPCNVVIIQALE